MTSPLDDLTTATVHLLAQGSVERIYGPPGTGKSTTLKGMIRDVVAEHGTESVLVTSFTVTAAKSLAGMDLPLPERQVGTLHSAAYRAIGTPDVALDAKVLKDWNSRVRADWRITSDGRRGSPDNVGDMGPGGDGGDELIAAYDMARSQLIPVGDMPAAVREFAQHWEGWKRDTGAIDFTDMIQVALVRAMDGERAPGSPKVIISDEAQDMTPLETALVLAWGAHAERTVLALDDDQAIMGWRGGNADPILSLGTGLDGGPQLGVDITDRVLDQSWRIPASLHTVAQTWIELCSHRRDKPYRPRDVDGQTYSVSHPIESMRTAEAIARDAHAGRQVMVIAACEYMLRVLVSNLRKLGVPFANRYRPLEGRWNPLRAAKGMTTAERLFRYLVLDERALGDRARLWTGDDVRAWLELVRTDAGLARGAKTAMKMLPAGELSIAQVEALFASEDALIRATEPELGWLLESVANKYADKIGYPAEVARAHGPAALMDPAPVTVGTIHSVKGGQADVVYLCPSVSGAGWGEWVRGGRARDHTVRQFYVGLTRAKETCVVLGSTERHIPDGVLCPREMEVR